MRNIRIFAFANARSRGIVTFEDFIVALIIISIATALLISNLFIFDHRTVEQMLEQRKVWSADSASDFMAKKYVKEDGQLELAAFDRPLPETMDVRVGELHYGGTAPIAGNIFASNRLVIVNGRPERLTVRIW